MVLVLHAKQHLMQLLQYCMGYLCGLYYENNQLFLSRIFTKFFEYWYKIALQCKSEYPTVLVNYVVILLLFNLIKFQA